MWRSGVPRISWGFPGLLGLGDAFQVPSPVVNTSPQHLLPGQSPQGMGGSDGELNVCSGGVCGEVLFLVRGTSWVFGQFGGCFLGGNSLDR